MNENLALKKLQILPTKCNLLFEQWEKIRQLNGQTTRLIRGGDAPKFRLAARIVTPVRGRSVSAKKFGEQNKNGAFSPKNTGANH
jgi:hypothetical protein